MSVMNIVWAIVLVILIYVLSRFDVRSSRLPSRVGRPVKVAIANMVTKQPDFDDWLKHHLDVLNVDRIYLRIENAPDIAALAALRPDRIFYEVSDDSGSKPNNYFSLIDRQRSFVSRMIEKAREDGVDYLFHVDSDELIHVPDGSQKLREHLESAPDDSSCIHMKNFEAVFNNNAKCFDAAKYLDCQRESCKSYANGKSAAVIRNNPEFNGPHYFNGKVFEMPDTKIRILHFDSCTYQSWKDKFSRLAASADPAKTKDIPFPFYRDSIALMKDGNETKAQTFYEQQKWTGRQESFEVSADPSKTIWSYWDSADLPELVKVCVKSWKIHNPEYNIILLSESSFRDYVNPLSIPKMWNLIPKTQQSDIIRLALLHQYGGFWLDATVLLNRPLNVDWSVATVGDLGGFNGEHHQTDLSKIVMETWFLVAPPNSPLVSDWHDEFINSFAHGSQTDFKLNREQYYQRLMIRKVNLQGIGSHEHPYYSVYFAFLAVTFNKTFRMKTLNANMKNNHGTGPFAYWSDDWSRVLKDRKYSHLPMIKFTRYQRDLKVSEALRQSTVGDVLFA